MEAFHERTDDARGVISLRVKVRSYVRLGFIRCTSNGNSRRPLEAILRVLENSQARNFFYRHKKTLSARVGNGLGHAPAAYVDLGSTVLTPATSTVAIFAVMDTA